MAVDKNKILDTANKLYQKGDFEKAIQGYREFLKLDPKNIQVRLRVGDLFLKLKKNDAAIAEYNLAAEGYTKSGFYPRAIAVYKQILRISPEVIDVYEKLADLYNKVGLQKDEVEQYRYLISIYEKKGNLNECIKILKKMSEIDPGNLVAKIKLAELYYNKKQPSEGALIFQSIYDFLAHHKKEDDMVTILERWLVVDPHNSDAVKSLSKIYLKNKQPQKLLLKLQAPLKDGIKDPEIFQYLAESYMQLNKSDKAKPVYKELAKIYLSKNNKQKAREAYQKVLGLDPQDAEALRFAKPSATQDVEIEILPEEEEETRPSPVSPSRIFKPGKQPPPVGGDRQNTVKKMLISAEIFMKYGVKDKAIEQYLQVLKYDPKNIQVLAILKDLYYSSGKISDTVKCLVTLSEISQENGELEEAIRHLEEAHTCEPSNKRVLKLLNAISPQSIAEPGDMAEPEHKDEALLNELIEAEEHVAKPDHDIRQPLEEPKESGFMDEGFADLMEEPVLKEEKKPVPAVEEDGIQDLFDEVEFYIQQGIAEEARKILREILLKRPDDQKAKKRLKELELLEMPVQEKESAVFEPVMDATTAAGTGESEHFDLARELEDELAEEAESGELDQTIMAQVPSQVSAEDVLAQFKDKLGSIVSKEDAETHFNLGIAYKEMGLMDESIAEFELSSTSPQKVIDSQNMLGLCYREKGNLQLSVESFKKALNAPDITNDITKSVLYELSKTYEDMGKMKLAQEILAKVVSMDETFRDAGDRLNALKSGYHPEVREDDDKGKGKKVTYI